LYNPENFNKLLNHVNNILTHPLSPNNLNDLITQVCKEKGISVNEDIATGFIYGLISEFLNGS
jgi:hypothetical protein